MVPKILRERLGMVAGQEVSLQVRDGRLDIEPLTTPVCLEDGPDGIQGVPDGALPPLTTDQMRETLEQTRR